MLFFRPEQLPSIDPHACVIIDVRTKSEHNAKHLDCKHIHAPLTSLHPSELMAAHGYGRDTAIYILCHSGRRAMTAAERFMAEGYQNVQVIEGGILACEKCGAAVKSAVSEPSGDDAGGYRTEIFRQYTRAISASLVFTGLILLAFSYKVAGVVFIVAGFTLIIAGIPRFLRRGS